MSLGRETIKNTGCQKENFLILQLISSHCKETDWEWKKVWAGQGKSLEAALAGHHHHFISSQTAHM